MKPEEVGRVFARAEESFERAAASATKTERALARADGVFERMGSRSSVARAAALRERQRLNAGLGRTMGKVLLVVVAVWVATMVIGFIQPIGLFGLLIAIAAAVLLGGATMFASRPGSRPSLPNPDLPSAALVERLDSYLFRARPALPAPAQAEIDQLLAALPALKPSLERVPANDPGAQDARRLMATHLPNLIDRYLNVPAQLRSEAGGDVSPDQRLVDALRTGREALEDAGRTLAKGDVAAFETQGRFIENRYGEQPLDR